MAKIVQFPHPAREYDVPDYRGEGCPCGWNTGDHRRRFLLSRGDYVDAAGGLQTGDLLFWSEWEANTRVTRLHRAVGQNLATWLHEPQYPIPCLHPVGNDDTHCCQNTDPCVFGASFKYALCRQRRDGSPTRMQNLEPGSLIVFGGTKDGTGCCWAILALHLHPSRSPMV